MHINPPNLPKFSKVKIKYPEIHLKKFHVSSPNLPKPPRFPKIRLPKIHLKKLNAEKKSEAAKNISPKKTKSRRNKRTIDLDKELKKRTEEIKEIEKLAKEKLDTSQNP